MNYLAHVLLARPDPESRLGALLGDFMQGVELGALPPRVRASVVEHRAIDGFTDGHPTVRRSWSRLAPGLRRFAPVLVDVFHDHFLVRHWGRFCPLALGAVTGGLYRALEEHRDLLPPRLERVAPAMARDDWLGSYGDLESVDRACAGIARRFRRPTPVAAGGAELRRRYAALEEDFLAFFPQLVAFVRAARSRACAPVPGRASTAGAPATGSGTVASSTPR